MYQRIELTRRQKPAAETCICLVASPPRPQSTGDDAVDRALAATIDRPECTGAAGEVTVADVDGRRLLVAGLGASESIDVDRVQAAGATLAAQLHRMAVGRADLPVDSDMTGALTHKALGRALGEGLGLGAFSFDDFRSKEGNGAGPDTLTLSVGEPILAAGIESGLLAADSANYARRLATTPPNVATPAYLADQARRLADRHGHLRCTVTDGDGLREADFQGLINVGRASEHQPCMIEMVYDPPNSTAATPTVLLVGKTITFDSGGLSLKIHDTMRYMKYDKGGGMAVLGAVAAIAQTRPPCRVVAMLPAAENAISDKAYRVDDIIRFPNGVSVEIANTDFEGRLVMADALIHGCEQYSPDAVIDLGTLTGGCITALGRHTAGLWCNDDGLQNRIEQAAARTAESVWPMPLLDQHHRAIRSHHADILNNTISTDAQPCICAAFLSRFVPADVPWAHFDIAGPVHVTEATPPFNQPGATGFGVRLLASCLDHWPAPS